MAETCTGRIVASEAHLPAAARAFVLIRRIRPRRSKASWALFGAMVVLNELRGLFLISHAWHAVFAWIAPS
jgi:hypothetical protein